jgi:hypothetical protein
LVFVAWLLIMVLLLLPFLFSLFCGLWVDFLALFCFLFLKKAGKSLSEIQRMREIVVDQSPYGVEAISMWPFCVPYGVGLLELLFLSGCSSFPGSFSFHCLLVFVVFILSFCQRFWVLVECSLQKKKRRVD